MTQEDVLCSSYCLNSQHICTCPGNTPACLRGKDMHVVYVGLAVLHFHLILHRFR